MSSVNDVRQICPSLSFATNRSRCSFSGKPLPLQKQQWFAASADLTEPRDVDEEGRAKWFVEYAKRAGSSPTEKVQQFQLPSMFLLRLSVSGIDIP